MMAEYNADVQHAIQIGEAAEENANAAAGSASDAASSASEAESSKVAAAGSALDAADSASEANDSKVAAAGSASDAADSASDANESKIAAAGSALDAADSASEANDSKVAAAGSASDAAGSASEANDSKVAAAGSASDAAGSASEANDSKVAAAGSASEAEFFAKISERYAKGTEDGVAVSSGEGYQDNAKYYKELCAQLASSVDGPELLAKITAIQDKIDAQEALNEARGGLAPGKYWWLGPEENLPERCFIINGQPLPKPTETSDLYKIPYGEFGDKYTTEETPSGYFGTPDFMTRADGTNGPNYIGSTGDFAQVGTKLIDTIRNITARFLNSQMSMLIGGAFIYDEPKNNNDTASFHTYTTMIASSFENFNCCFGFNAGRDVWSIGNPAAGHTGDNIHPFTILALPIYIY